MYWHSLTLSLSSIPLLNLTCPKVLLHGLLLKTGDNSWREETNGKGSTPTSSRGLCFSVVSVITLRHPTGETCPYLGIRSVGKSIIAAAAVIPTQTGSTGFYTSNPHGRGAQPNPITRPIDSRGRGKSVQRRRWVWRIGFRAVLLIWFLVTPPARGRAI